MTDNVYVSILKLIAKLYAKLFSEEHGYYTRAYFDEEGQLIKFYANEAAVNYQKYKGTY